MLTDSSSQAHSMGPSVAGPHGWPEPRRYAAADDGTRQDGRPLVPIPAILADLFT